MEKLNIVIYLRNKFCASENANFYLPKITNMILKGPRSCVGLIFNEKKQHLQNLDVRELKKRGKFQYHEPKESQNDKLEFSSG